MLRCPQFIVHWHQAHAVSSSSAQFLGSSPSLHMLMSTISRCFLHAERRFLRPVVLILPHTDVFSPMRVW